MLDASYIGEDLTGTGLALVGIRAHPVPESTEQLWQLVLNERDRRQLVMLSADCARQIGEPLHALLETHPLPPVLVLPDPETGQGPDEVINEAFAALGIEDMSE